MTALVLASAAPAGAVVLDVVGGELQGASTVSVDGVLFDVEFLDGTCIDLMDGCDEASDFAFQNVDDAEQASLALLAQVFVDSPAGLFDSRPDVTRGCANPESCQVFTIFGRNLPGPAKTSAVVNDESTDLVLVFVNTSPSFDTGGASFGGPQTVFAIWSVAAAGPPPSTVAAPAPFSLLLLGVGLAAAVSRVRARAIRSLRVEP